MSHHPRHGPHAARARARKRALQALFQWSFNPLPAAQICQQFVEEQDMSQVDQPYFEQLVTEAVNDVAALDAGLSEHLDREIRMLDPMELSILRLAACELRQHLEIPYRVVLNEAVELAREFGSDQTPVFVNGVLDRCARQWREIEYRADHR